VCARNPDKDRAKIEKHNRDYAHLSKSNQFHNKETSYKKSRRRNVIGFSRGRSDIQSKALSIIGKGRQLKEDAARSYAIKSSAKSAEGGRSTRAGRNEYLALLTKQARIESKISNTLGRDQSSAIQGITRQYQNKEATNRSKLGLPPEYGPRVMYRKQSLWEKSQPVRDIVGLAIPFLPSN